MKSVHDLLRQYFEKIENEVNDPVTPGVQYQVDEETQLRLEHQLEPMFRSITDAIARSLGSNPTAGTDRTGDEDGRLTRE
jgi:hypothetical protein